MSKAVNIEHCFGKFNDTFSPKIVGELNGQNVKLARLEGDKVRRTRTQRGRVVPRARWRLDVLERDGAVTLHPGEFTVVARGREHRVVPHGHVKLIGSSGDAQAGRSAEITTIQTTQSWPRRRRPAPAAG